MWAQRQRLSFSPSTRRSRRVSRAPLVPLQTTFLGRRGPRRARASTRGGAIVVHPRGARPVSAPSAGDGGAIGDAYRASGRGKLTGTTHISVVDGDGTAAALSSTLGSGSSVFRGGAQLNNMLGELDVIGREPRAAGTRLLTMLTPTLVLGKSRPWLVLGSAGSVRLAGAIAQVVWHVVARSLPIAEAIAAPRAHAEGGPPAPGGWPAAEIAGSKRSKDVVRWGARNPLSGACKLLSSARTGSSRRPVTHGAAGPGWSSRDPHPPRRAR